MIRTDLKIIAALTFLAMVQALPAPVLGQDREQLKDIFDKAQKERDKRAVDDLIKRLEQPGAKRGQPTPPPSAPQTPPIAGPPPPAPPETQPTPPRPPVAGTSPPQVLPPLGRAPAAPQPPSPPVAQPRSPPPGPPPAPAEPPAPIAERPPAPPAPLEPPPGAPPPEVMDRAPEMAKRLALPTVDIEVVFDFNSSEITAKAAEQLRTLGQAMADPRLADARFVIAGHTDARGRPAYNLTLSQARAEAVRWHIVQTYGIKAENLFARGFGQRQLKNRANPRADENRRVQIINFTGVAADGRRRR